VFKPDAARGTKGPQAFSGIGEDGTFTLSTLETDDGAVVGTHKIGITAFDPVPVQVASVDPLARTRGDAPPPPATGAAPGGKGAGSSATFTGLDGVTHRYLTPAKLRDPETSGIVVEVAPGENHVTIAIQEDGTCTVSK